MEDLERSFADVRAADPPVGLQDRILAAARGRRRGWRAAPAAALLVALCLGLNWQAAHRIESLRRSDFEARTGRPYETREPGSAPGRPLLPEDWAMVMASLERRS